MDRLEDGQLSLELARTAIELGADENYIRLFDNMENVTPETLSFGFELAMIYIELGLIEKAAALYRRLLEIHRENGDLAKMAEILKRLKIILPEERELYIELGNIFLETGKLNEAEAEFRTILRQNLNDIEALLLLGKTCQQQGITRDAILAYNKVLQINSQEITAKQRLKEIYETSK